MIRVTILTAILSGISIQDVLCFQGNLFGIVRSKTHEISTITLQRDHVPELRIVTGLAMAGFGGGGQGKPKKAATAGLKPKAQWDRYLELKKETAVAVGVRIIEPGKEEDWLEVGNIKSVNGEFNQLAVALQRALIADHAKRLFPLKLRGKERLEWGLYNVETKTFDAVDKSLTDGMDEFDTKQIGFEGTGDPKTGFYCHYNDGRLVSNRDEKSEAPATKKKG